jgi:hypothetical protein
VSNDGTLFTLNNHLTREQSRRVAEVLHEHGIERASFTAVQVPDGVRLEVRGPVYGAPSADDLFFREWRKEEQT